MTAKIIINADDYGWDNDANQAIFTLAEAGHITSTSIMANMVDNNWLKKINHLTHISKGIHINLFSGIPLSPAHQVKSITDAKGNFLDHKFFLRKLITNQIDFKEIKLEIRNQIQHLLTAGLNLSHADSHRHLHQFPLVSQSIIETAKEMGIHRFRNCNVNNVTNLKMLTVRLFCILTRNNFKNCITPSVLYNLSAHKDTYSANSLLKEIKKLSNKPVIEIMTHPGIANRQGSYLNRTGEYTFLLKNNLPDLLSNAGYKLVNYSDL
ncbi:MAG: ChbG/HpnK family deacetylase [Pseudomonadota bacterium]